MAWPIRIYAVMAGMITPIKEDSTTTPMMRASADNMFDVFSPGIAMPFLNLLSMRKDQKIKRICIVVEYEYR